MRVTTEYIDSVIEIKHLTKEAYFCFSIEQDKSKYVATVYRLDKSFLVMLKDDSESTKNVRHRWLTNCVEDIANKTIILISKKFNVGQFPDVLSNVIWIQDDRGNGPSGVFQIEFKCEVNYAMSTMFIRLHTPNWICLKDN